MTFAEEIEANKSAEKVADAVAKLETVGSELNVRLRGAYITKCELTSPTSGQRVGVLYSDSDMTRPKISATHPMVPAGPYEGIGGQHGFARWADYDEARASDTETTLTARRSDGGLGLSKRFELDSAALMTVTAITNPQEQPERTSLGEHIYFALAEGKIEGLKLNGQSLDELLGEGSEAAIANDKTLRYDFGGEARIDFPAGHSVKMTADFEGETQYPLAMWIWKRRGSASICFEPVVGVRDIGLEDNRGLMLPVGGRAVLSARLELL